MKKKFTFFPSDRVFSFLQQKQKQLFLRPSSYYSSYFFFFSLPAATALWKSGISGAATAVTTAIRL